MGSKWSESPHDKFYNSDGDVFSELIILTILSQVAEGMQSLAANGVIHKDLSARNILVFAFDENSPTPNICVKVADMGMSSLLGQSASHYYGEGVVDLPVRWMAPESLTGNRWSEFSDVFSFGVLIWEMLSGGQVPWGLGTSNKIVQDMVVAGDRLPCSSSWPGGLVELMNRCFNATPKQRPKFSAIKELLAEMIAKCDLASPTQIHNAAAAVPAAKPEEVMFLIIKRVALLTFLTFVRLQILLLHFSFLLLKDLDITRMK